MTTIADPYAPMCRIYVDSVVPRFDLTRDLISAEFEDASDIVSAIKFTLANDNNFGEFPQGKYTDTQFLSPGTEVSIWLGYGTELEFVAKGQLIRAIPDFPVQGTPTIQYVAYDRSHSMAKQAFQVGGSQPTRKETGRNWSGYTLAGLVSTIAKWYECLPIVSPELATIVLTKLSQKKGVTDFEFLKQLANVYDCSFKVRCIKEKWTLFFQPTNIARSSQTVKYIFDRTGEVPTLLSANLEYGLNENLDQIRATVYDARTQQWTEITEAPTKETKKIVMTKLKVTDTAGEVKDMSVVKLSANNQSIKVLTRPFSDASEAAKYIHRWVEQHRDSIVTAQITLPGHERVKAGDTHTLLGLGRYSGDYYFHNVRHIYNESSYRIEAVCHKVITA